MFQIAPQSRAVARGVLSAARDTRQHDEARAAPRDAISAFRPLLELHMRDCVPRTGARELPTLPGRARGGHCGACLGPQGVKAPAQLHLGFEVGSGNAVSIPVRNMVVCGQTQEAGKTTTLEALIARASVPAVAFVTKRGEQSFAAGRRIAPYFRERADWQFVASVLEATMRERLKFERAWIMRASKGARTLADVHNNVRK